jgi:hypothetical protein
MVKRGERAASAPAAVDVHTAHAQEELTRALQTKVEIRRQRRGGTVRIHFYSEEELIRLFDLLAKAAKTGR